MIPLRGVWASAALPPAVGNIFHMLLICKDVYKNVSVFVADTASESALLHAPVGMNSLKNHRVWLSYGTETLFLQSLPDSAQ